MVSPDGVAPSRMISVSVNLPLHHKVHPGGPGKMAVKRLWWCGVVSVAFLV